MPRLKLTIEYAGTRYSGWQIQKNARTVQGEIDRAVRAVTGRNDFELYGSGRTDAGVHAAAQVAHLDVATSLGADQLAGKINDLLPSDIHILSATVVPHRFHARHDAVARRYLYQVSRRRTAFAKAYVWWVKDPLDLERMRRAARSFVGMRDFMSIVAPDDIADEDAPAKSTIVLIDRVDIVETATSSSSSSKGRTSSGRWCGASSACSWRSAGARPSRTRRSHCSPIDRTARRAHAPASGLFLHRVFYKHEPR